LALQIGRFVQHWGVTQTVAAARLRIPQPTLSKIIRSRVSDLSIELLIRVAVRGNLAVTLLTGQVPEEAGAFVTALSRIPSRQTPRSRLAEEARQLVAQSDRRLTPAERLEAFLEHSQLLGALYQAGRFSRPPP
jgi:predicted XRE-type DNA-binding protein